MRAAMAGAKTLVSVGVFGRVASRNAIGQQALLLPTDNLGLHTYSI